MRQSVTGSSRRITTRRSSPCAGWPWPPLLALLCLGGAAAAKRDPGAAIRRAAAHPSVRDEGRGALYVGAGRDAAPGVYAEPGLGSVRDVWYAHGIHFNDEELRLLAETGTGVCPLPHLQYEALIAASPAFRRCCGWGFRWAWAVDGSASNDGSNLLGGAAGELPAAPAAIQRQAAPTGYDLLKVATMGGARLLGREREIGSLEPGKCADLFLVDARRLELVGACYDPKAMLCTVGLKQPVDYTIANGKICVARGRLTGVDEGKLAQSAEREVRRYLAYSAGAIQKTEHTKGKKKTKKAHFGARNATQPCGGTPRSSDWMYVKIGGTNHEENRCIVSCDWNAAVPVCRLPRRERSRQQLDTAKRRHPGRW